MKGLGNKVAEIREPFAADALGEKACVVVVEVEANDSFQGSMSCARFAIDQLESGVS